MGSSIPVGREARAALFTSWLVLAYLLLQVAASMSWQFGLTVDGIRHMAGVVVSIACTVGFLRLQGLVLARHAPPYLSRLRWTLIVTGFVLLPATDAWAMLAISFATLLLVPSVRQIEIVGGALSLLTILWLWFDGVEVVLVIAVPMICWLAGGVIVVLTRMAVVLEQLRQAREEIARMQVDQERHRISRELHDILGRTLIAASLRTQTALRLIDTDVEGCRGQLRHLGRDLSDGQSQLRELVSGRTFTSLTAEIQSAVDLFDRLGVEVQVEDGEVSGSDAQLLGARVVREAVTNLLRHSRPHLVQMRVRSRAGHLLLRVENDGAPPPQATTEPMSTVGSASDSGGTGLSVLAEAVSEAGGELRSGPSADGGFVVEADIPTRTQAPHTPLRPRPEPGLPATPKGP